MKKTILFLGFLFFGNFIVLSQNGLEKIIVEKFYVSNAADSIGSVGTLPVGSVTYRIYADMLPGYKFQALYGESGVNPHKLIVKSSTKFFNNEDFGANYPDNISTKNLKKNTVLLDSWFSVGAAGSGKIGVLKTEDTDGSLFSTNTILINNDSAAGKPISLVDGMIAGDPKSVTSVGLTNEINVFGSLSQSGGSFETSDGSIASLEGSVGPNAENRVLVGQFTTDGIFSFKLNVQIGTPSGVTEKYVAENPSSEEKQIPSLIGFFNPKALNNKLPNISLSSPSSAIAGDKIEILASASDPDGSIVSVEFFVDGKSIGIDLNQPFSFIYSTTAGNHIITATATDDLGATSISNPLSLNVLENQTPVVSLVASSKAFAGQSLEFSATANDYDGKIKFVEFFINYVSIGIDSVSPYIANWNAIFGQHELIAIAYDDRGSKGSSSSQLIEVTKSKPPFILIANPIAGAKIITGDTLNIIANSSDSDGVVLAVEFFIDGVSSGIDSVAPYSVSYKSVLGYHIISAKSIDNDGDTAFSIPVAVHVQDNQAPIITFSVPQIALVGDSLTITADVSDIDGSVAFVEFVLNDSTLIIDSLAPFSTKCNIVFGSNIIKIKATDDRGLSALSIPDTIRGVYNMPPTVSIISPINNTTTISGDTVLITAQSEDVDGFVRLIEFFVDGNSIGVDSVSPYSVYYIGSLGNHSMVAKSVDDDGDSTFSSAVNIVVSENKSPLVNLIFPSLIIENDLVTINAETSDSDGFVSSVHFFVDDVFLGKDSLAPFSIKWNSPIGQHRVSALAFDDRGLQGYSREYIVDVKKNTEPTVFISAPDTATAGDLVLISASASDVDGTIASVQFFVNGNSIGFYAKSPYTIKWKAIEGINSITAKAKDNKGAITTSEVKVIKVRSKNPAPNIKPLIVITSPFNNKSFFSGDSIIINSTASDSDGTIANVQFFIDGVFYVLDSVIPYSAAAKAILGNHVLTALAIDNKGDSAFSLPVQIIVANRDTSNKAPQIILSAPDSAFVGSDVEITAAASDSDGFIVSVDFFINNIFQRSDTIAPYSTIWKATQGNNIITAKAKDNKGKITIASAKNIRGILTSGVADAWSDEETFSLFPNPTNSELFVQYNSTLKSSLSYKIYNVIGELMKQWSSADSGAESLFSLDLSSFPSGNYIIEVVCDGKSRFKKIIKY